MSDATGLQIVRTNSDAGGSGKPQKLSGPPVWAVPRPMTEVEKDAIARLGDALIPRVGENPSFSDLEDWEELLDVALAAWAEVFDQFVDALAQFAGADDVEPMNWLRDLDRHEPTTFFTLSALICGTYFMAPRVRTIIKVPALEPHPPSITAAADDLEDGILDPVMARGATFTPTDDCPR